MTKLSMIASLGVLVALAAGACCPEPPPEPLVPKPVPPPATASAEPAPPPDPLGEKPAVATPPPYVPPVPTVYTATNGMKVWLLERHNLPLVSIVLAEPVGAASDPKGKGGLALETANMLDEGAGKLGAIDLAKAVDALGASLGTTADADSSFVSLTVLSRNLKPAMAIFGDVVARPRFDPNEWKRVHTLWLNDLKERASEPDATARVIYRAALFGDAHPYGHPWDGTTSSAKSVDLGDVRRFYSSAWRPDTAVLVAVGDTTREALDPILTEAFKGWTAPMTPTPQPLVPPAPSGPWPRLVMVDRPDAPQSVIAVVRPGIAASDPDDAPIDRANTAIGGSFTSRLNQDLREEHGWSYGAHSRVAFTRGVGQVVSYASVVTDHTGEALKAMLGDLDHFAKGGLTDDEVEMTRSYTRGELVSAYQTTGGAAHSLAGDAALGLPPDFEATTAAHRDAATRDDLGRVAAKYYDPKDAIVVIVGPREKVQPQLEGLGLPVAELRDADGTVIHLGK